MHSKIYVLDREGFEYIDQLMIYTSREAAVELMLKYALRTKCVALIYVFERKEEMDEAPLMFVETIRLKLAEDPRFYMIWEKQKELGLIDREAFNNLALFYDTIETVHADVSI